MHILVLVTVALATLIAGFVVGMCATAKQADAEIAKGIQDCTRPTPHICKINGPCNGYPKTLIRNPFYFGDSITNKEKQ